MALSYKKPEYFNISYPRNMASRFILKQSLKASECLLNESLGILHNHLSITFF